MSKESIEEILKSIGSEDVPAEVRKIARETSRDFSETLMRPRQHILWSDIMKSPITKLAAAAVIIIAVLVGIRQFGGPIDGTSMAFGEVIEKHSYIQTLHARLNKNGRESEIWAKRPNMLRMEYNDGTYEISNGPKMWVVDEKNNKAIEKPSWYFKDAQRRGIDVLDALVRMEYTDNFSGFFSEGPVKQISKNDNLFDVYQMEFDSYGDRIEFEALVDSETRIIYSMTVGVHKEAQLEQFFELTILDYDQPIPDEMFAFEPTDTMEVTVKEFEGSEPTSAQTEGSRLSGHITWASSGKPVSGARLTFWGGQIERTADGKSKHKFFVRAETDCDGCWQITGAPSGGLSISVRSWELGWPAMPTFTTNVGSPLHPRIIIDGESEYGSLNFKVYKPGDFYARITINVSDEDGKPVEGLGGYLQCDDNFIHQHLYAVPRKRQYTSSDGRFDADDIWPTKRPVRIYLGPRQDFGVTYATRNAQTEAFVIEPKQSYHFDIIVPYVRQMKTQVLDPQGKPLEGISVLALDENGAPFFPLPQGRSAFTGKFTNSNGLVDISGMAPGENIVIALRRLDPTQPDWKKPLASACIPATAPYDMEKPTLAVTFDERPICIEGSSESDLQIEKGGIRVMVAGQHGELGMPFMWTRFDNTGGFKLEGVPAGHIRLLCTYIDSEKGRITVEESMHTKPGNIYTVKFTEHNIQLLAQQPNQ